MNCIPRFINFDISCYLFPSIVFMFELSIMANNYKDCIMEKLKKLTRKELQSLKAGNLEETVEGGELEKCGPTWCAAGKRCCYHAGGSFYYCGKNGTCD